MLFTFGYVEHLLEVLVGRVDLHGEGRHQVQQQQNFNDDFYLHKNHYCRKTFLKNALISMCHFLKYRTLSSL
jgi:hypothetical protein